MAGNKDIEEFPSPESRNNVIRDCRGCEIVGDGFAVEMGKINKKKIFPEL